MLLQESRQSPPASSLAFEIQSCKRPGLLQEKEEELFQGRGLVLLLWWRRAIRKATTTHVTIAQLTLNPVCAKRFPPIQMTIPKHTNASSRQPTGGQTRCEGVTKLGRKRLAVRDKVLESPGQANLDSEPRTARIALSRKRPSSQRHA